MENIGKTNLFLDTVIFEEIVRYSWMISGVTTTPTFFKRDRVDIDELATKIRNEFPNLELHVEALGFTAKETEIQLKNILGKSWFNADKVIIKIPVSFENLKIVSNYSKKGIKFNTHLVFNTSQAYLATLSGTTYVCPLVGRYADSISALTGTNLHGGENDIGRELLLNVISAVRKCPINNQVRVMASSIRTVGDFVNSILAGVDVVTVPTKILELSIENEYTNQGIQAFLKNMGQ